MSSLHLGKSMVDITPYIGIHLSGWAGERYSQTIHQPLTCRVLYLRKDEKTVVWVSLDVLGISNQFADEVRNEAEKKLGISAADIMLSATHTHSGPILYPCVFPDHPLPDDVYVTDLKRKIVGAILAASRQLTVVKVGYGKGHSDLGVNRRLPYDKGKCAFPPKADPHGPVDREIGVLRFQSLDGRTQAVLFSYGCHPTVGGNSLWIGPDYPGPARQLIESYYGAQSMAMFILGNCGDVRSNYVNADGTFDWKVSTETIEEAGCRIGAEVLRAASQIKPAENADLTSSRVYKDIYMKNGQIGSTCEFQAFKIGECVIATNPGECFSEIGLNVRKEIQVPIVFSSITNGLLGYVPTAKAHAQEGYEVTLSYKFFGLDSPIRENGEDVFFSGMLESIQASLSKG